MKTDKDLQHDVLAELEWEPSVEASKIGVTAEKGVITVTGYVSSYTEKMEAEKVAKRVVGVQAVANDLEVRLPGTYERTDGDLAQLALSALDWNVSVPKNKVHVTVSKGWMALEGEVEWYYQKRAAEEAVRNLVGVRGISNHITITPALKASEVKTKIEAALRRNAELDAKKIDVETTDGKVILRGKVRSWAEHEDAIGAAWAAPGVKKVEDHLVIRP
jgi:osmotically-inducible protein OsmY